MPRRKASKTSKARGSGNWHSNRHTQAHVAAPLNGRRAKAQRHLLLGDDFELNSDNNPGLSLGHHNMTLQQEARNTEERSSRRSNDKKLRQLGIKFVPPKETTETLGGQKTVKQSTFVNPASIQLHSPIGSTLFESTLAEEEYRNADQLLELAQSSYSSQSASLASQAIVSCRPSETVGGSSSEEELVFIPRNKRRPDNPKSKEPNRQSQTNTAAKIRSRTAEPVKTGHFPGGLPAPEEMLRHSRIKLYEPQDSDDEITADYIENMESGDINDYDVFSLRPLGNHLDDIDLGSECLFRQGAQSEDAESLPGIESDQIDMEVDVNVALVIGKRRGEAGTEYHFKPVGSSIAEAIWLQGTDLVHDIQHLIDHFEAGLADSGNSGSGSEASEMPVGIDWERERDRNIIDLFKDNDSSDNDGDEFNAADLLSMMLGESNKQGKFPSASKLAEAYDEFDVMDRGRASLAGTSKRKKRKNMLCQSAGGEVTTAGDDEAEIRAELERFILQDRGKKKVRRQERERLRQLGILGKSKVYSETASLDIRGSSNGMSLSQVHVAIRHFLMNGSTERLSLVPMPKEDRLHIHILAHKFFMQSKSQGKGNSRFPVLYKTKRTRLFEGDEKAIDNILRSPGLRTQGRLGGTRNRDNRHLKGSYGEHKSHKDGMVVGTGAAEIGQGNKGYEMLARMGWTTGTGLGSNRSGILDPVQAIVKNTRAGLG